MSTLLFIAPEREPTVSEITPGLRKIVEGALSWEEAAPFVDAGSKPTSQALALLTRWKRLINLRSNSELAFSERLQYLGWSEEEALSHLSFVVLPDDFPLPNWATVLSVILSPESNHVFPSWEETRELCGVGLARQRESADGTEKHTPIFVSFLAPFVAWALQKMRDETSFEKHFSYSAQEDLACSLLRRLSFTASRMIAHELKRAGSRGELWAATSEDRYQLFIEDILPARRSQLLERYPVLARILAVITMQFASNTAEIARRVEKDHAKIRRLTGAHLSPFSKRVIPFMSDVHDEGHSAWKLTFATFDGGADVTVYYKPRSFAIDEAWSGLIGWLQKKNFQPVLQTVKVLDCGSYGWCCEVQEVDCHDEDEIAAYFQRQGVQSALITALGGQDFHAENFIAAGCYPVPIDLEGLLAPVISAPFGELACLPLTMLSLQYSGAGNLMLPYFRAGEPGQPLYCSSGVGGTGKRQWPRKLPQWTDQDTDQLRLEYVHQDIRFDESLPTLKSKKVSADGYRAEISSGIEKTFRFLLEHREELLAPGSPLEAFRGLSSRTLFRDTQEYSDLMFWTTSPDILESGAAYDVALEVLAGAPPVFCNGASFPNLVDKEKESFWQRDIPMGTTLNTSTELQLSDGTCFAPILAVSAWEQLTKRFEQWTPMESTWQSSVANALLTMSRDSDAPDSSNLLDAAIRIGDELAASAIRVGEDVSWIILARGQWNDRVYPLQSNPWELNGNAGNAIFLAELARISGASRFADLARQALLSAHRSLLVIRETSFQNAIGLSAYTGGYGLIYGLLRAGIVLKDETLVDTALQTALLYTPEQLEAETNPDFLTGIAGTLSVIAALHQYRPENLLEKQANACAKAIVATARNQGRDGWQVPFFSRPLLGMAHGSSGVAAGLLLSAELRRASAASEVLAAFEHERRHFQPDIGRWPNLQREDKHFMTGWCAGPAGIGIARLLALRSSEAAILRERNTIERDLEDALDAAQGCIGAAAHHACCGDAGSILFLAMAARQLHRADLLDQATVAAHSILASFREHSVWRMQDFVESMPLSGLLAGLPGIGMAFLSVIDPHCSEFLSLC